MKKIISLLLSVCFLFSLSMTTFAAEGEINGQSISPYGAAEPVTKVTIESYIEIGDEYIFTPNSIGNVGVWVSVIGSGNATMAKYDGKDIGKNGNISSSIIDTEPILYPGTSIVKGIKYLFDCGEKPIPGTHTFEVRYRSVNFPYNEEYANATFDIAEVD